MPPVDTRRRFNVNTSTVSCCRHDTCKLWIWKRFEAPEMQRFLSKYLSFFVFISTDFFSMINVFLTGFFNFHQCPLITGRYFEPWCSLLRNKSHIMRCEVYRGSDAYFIVNIVNKVLHLLKEVQCS